MCKRILYVEDNPRNMLLVRRILEAEGHELIEAVDGESGWETAVSQRPDFILMDLRLPGEISGFELTRRLKATSRFAAYPHCGLDGLWQRPGARKSAGRRLHRLPHQTRRHSRNPSYSA